MTISSARRAGVCLHVTALPGPYGIGTLGAHARRFVDRLASSGLTLWQVLPTGPTGYGDSPYQLLSVFAGNPMLIDPVELARDGWLTGAELASLPDGDDGHVEFAEVVPARAAALRHAALRFDAGASVEQRARFDEFCARHDARWLDSYADFSVLKRQHNGQPWYDWPEDLAAARPAALDIWREQHQQARRHVRIIQFFFHEQWREMRQYAHDNGVYLVGDAPIYVAHDSADTWSRRDLLQFNDDGTLAAVGGVPPDYFSADGQLWGNPLYDWAAHEKEGFDWWIARLAHACELNDQVRIDHFRGFEAYWSVPADAPNAREGQWIPGPCEALFDALTAALPDVPIIAEDLGLITPPVQELRQRYGLPGMAVLHFLLQEDGFDPAHIGEDRVCYTGTHDNDTTRGWFDEGDGPDDHWRRERVLAMTGGTAQSVPSDLIDMALHCPARYAIFPMQDLLGLPTDCRFNTPGTTKGNWRWRLRESEFTDALCFDMAQRVALANRDLQGQETDGP